MAQLPSAAEMKPTTAIAMLLTKRLRETRNSQQQQPQQQQQQQRRPRRRPRPQPQPQHPTPTPPNQNHNHNKNHNQQPTTTTTNSQQPPANSQPPTTDHQPPATNHHLLTTHHPSTTNHQPPPTTTTTTNNNNKAARASAAARGVSVIFGRFFGQKLENLSFVWFSSTRRCFGFWCSIVSCLVVWVTFLRNCCKYLVFRLLMSFIFDHLGGSLRSFCLDSFKNSRFLHG